MEKNIPEIDFESEPPDLCANTNTSRRSSSHRRESTSSESSTVRINSNSQGNDGQRQPFPRSERRDLTRESTPLIRRNEESRVPLQNEVEKSQHSSRHACDNLVPYHREHRELDLRRDHRYPHPHQSSRTHNPERRDRSRSRSPQYRNREFYGPSNRSYNNQRQNDNNGYRSRFDNYRHQSDYYSRNSDDNNWQTQAKRIQMQNVETRGDAGHNFQKRRDRPRRRCSPAGQNWERPEPPHIRNVCHEYHERQPNVHSAVCCIGSVSMKSEKPQIEPEATENHDEQTAKAKSILEALRKCNACRKPFPTRREATYHLSQVHEKRVCSVCYVPFPIKGTTLKEHFIMEHTKADKKEKAECPVCQNKYNFEQMHVHISKAHLRKLESPDGRTKKNKSGVKVEDEERKFVPKENPGSSGQCQHCQCKQCCK